MWIDTHCHLDAPVLADAVDTAERAAQQGVAWIVIPAVEKANFQTVAKLAHQSNNAVYALGIHPMFVPQADESDLLALRAAIPAALSDTRFVAIGEIGLDFFVPALCTSAMREKQEHFYVEQLKIARDFALPVLLHVRRSQDQILKYLRRIRVPGGVAHAFNGSFQQAEEFIRFGFKLGFGGAMTFPRALQIRRLATQLPLDSIVLETDAPDGAPVWVHGSDQPNSPEQLPRIGAALAQLRNMPPCEIAQAMAVNAGVVLPRLARLSGLFP